MIFGHTRERVAGTVLTAGVSTYELYSGDWDAHTIVNTGLLLGGVAATVFGSPVILTGIALYGIGEFVVDFSGQIDSAIGKDSSLW